MSWIGIDPGLSGGIAVIDPIMGVRAYKMPDTERDILELMRSLADPKAWAIVERVASMPRQGVVSVWKFSGNYHGLRMALHAAEIPFEAVPPGVWQRTMGCLTKGDKQITRRKAQELFPQLRVTHATADALLLAEYGRRLRTHEGRHD